MREQCDSTGEVGERGDRSPCANRSVVLAAVGLSKDFGSLRAVDNLSLSVCRGDVYGFLGPNGAGKSTVIRMILGLIRPTAGHVEVLGLRIPGQRTAALHHLGGFVDDPVFYSSMSARKNLWLLGSMSGVADTRRIDDVLAVVGLMDRADSRVGGFSHGMKQRLGIAQALLHRPDIVVLDEPTSGLDPGGMKDVRELVRGLGRDGITVFLSSHLLYEVEQVCTRAAIVSRGRVVAEGPVDGLRPAGMAVKLLVDDRAAATQALAELPNPPVIETDGEYLIATLPDEQIPEAVRRLVDAGVSVRAVVPAPERGLEDVFLELTQADEAREGRPPSHRRGRLWGAGR